MDTMFENLDFRFDKENNDERPFIIACKDREIIDGERWVLASLSTDEAKRFLLFMSCSFRHRCSRPPNKATLIEVLLLLECLADRQINAGKAL